MQAEHVRVLELRGVQHSMREAKATVGVSLPTGRAAAGSVRPRRQGAMKTKKRGMY